jgi:hypothetical protein
MNKYYKFLPIILVLSFLSAGLIYCGGGGGGGTAATGAFNLTEDNMVEAAEFAAGDDGLYYNLSIVALGMVQGLAGGGGPTTAAIIPFGDLGLCANFPSGTAELSVNDADNSLDLTIGDVATLALTNCDFSDDPLSPSLIDGTLALTFVAISPVMDNITADVSINLEIDEIIDSVPQTEAFVANFQMQATTSDFLTYVISITAPDSNDIIEAKLNGETQYRYGCFDVTLTFIATIEDVYTLVDSGVVNAPGKGIMSVTTSSSLEFFPGLTDPYADSGSMNILSGGDCAGIGTAEGDGTYIILTATGGGSVTLQLYDIGDTPVGDPVNTTWDLLD